MEEDVGVKVTVTRLRRRLSVEQSEDGSIGGSPGPATPTKKRGGRLAAKPQLELIEENAPVSSPRKTRRKSLATDAEEKAITPSRRSVRIKSNTSIVSDTLSVQATASPRAIRAARRYSQTGSDNEGPATPARQTRRTRKDSASSVENQEPGTLNKPLPVAEIVIEEEPENEVQKAVNISKSSPTAAMEELSPNARKSQRLLEKRNRHGSHKTDQNCSCCSIENKSLNISTKEKVSTKTESHSPHSSLNKSDKSKESNDDLSESNLSLLNELERKLKGNKLDHNKSASAFDTSGNDKRNRTESWPVVTASTANESINFSDNELLKKKKEKSNISFSPTNNSSNKSNTSIHETNTSQSFLDTSLKRKQRKSETNIEDAAIPCEDVLNPNANKISDKKTPSNKSGNTDITGDMAMLFENRPDNVQISVYYEDSDSNSVVTETANQNKKIDSEDQCVPEVVVIPNAEKSIVSSQVSDDSEKVSSTDVSISQLVSNDDNNSCEPMDIDETIHEEILQKSLSSSRHSIIEATENSKRKSSISGSTTDSPNRSKNDKRKSSISNTAVDTPDQSKNDKRKSSTSNTAVDTPDRSKNDKRKSSISNTAAYTPDQSKNDKRKSSISNTAVDTPDQSENDKRKSSISNTAVGTPDRSKNDKRKSSISNTAAYTPDQSKNDKRKSSISNTAVDTPDQSKNDKRKSSISNTAVDTPGRSINDKRKSSISNSGIDTPDRSKNNSTADTPDLSKNENNKSTLILSQLKDVSTTSENLKLPKSALKNEVLSKSDINDTDNKKISKGNLSLNDVKGTPKQYSVQKLTMQTSTPIASQQVGIITKVEEQKQESASKKKSNFYKSINDTDSSEEDSDDELSSEKNKHLDDEAEEASGDYESGDSQNEEERMYVAENEIVVRGETLTSDDDASNDTDYEKDSFVISSDAEDNGLLSGSGDDLSMSDNELSMSKKSKKKFNDRKIKEQKNASREMFESRHKLNTSDKNSPSPKTKKKRMRIDSSLSDEEVVVTTKKPNRMRLDSTLDSSVKVETNVSLNKSNKNKSTLGTSVTQEETNTSLKKKKNKSMQDAIFNKSAIDENEITVCNESAIENADPLEIQIKQEPKTPQKDLNISVVQVQQDIEGVQVTESNSILDQTGTDPLQATMACEYTSDSSESEEIMQNYDSVLNELNKDRKTKLNNKNASLNMGKTSNKKEPIIDQLNLTEAKKSKKNKVQLKDDSESKTVKLTEKKQDTDNEDSSSSIDLQLLFSEDNCGSDDEQMSQQNKAGDDNMFIPLKKSPGKTNLCDSIGMNTSQKGTTLNGSSNKKNKKINSSIGPAESVDEQGEVVNESILNKSNSKKKKQRASLTAAESEELEVSDNFNVSKNVNTSRNESGMKKKNKHSVSEPPVEETQGTLNAVEPEPHESTKKKKKRKSSLSAQTEGDLFFIDTTGSLQDNKDDCGEFAEPTLNNVYERKKKKKKNKLDDVQTEQNDEYEFAKPPLNNVYKRKKKKKKNKLYDVRTKTEQNDDCGELTELPLNNVYKRKKKKQKNKLDDVKTEHNGTEPLKVENELNDLRTKTEQNENTVVESNAVITPKSGKKKKKHSISEISFVESQENTIENAAITPKSEKKNKKHSILEPPAEETQGNTAMTPKSEKKKKKHSTLEPSAEESADEYEVAEPPLNNVYKRKKKKKKNKLDDVRTKTEQNDECGEFAEPPLNNLYERKKKKKKNRLDDVRTKTEQIDDCGELTEPPLNNVYKRKKKKQKNKLDDVKTEHNENTVVESNAAITPKSGKKKKKHSISEISFVESQENTIENAAITPKSEKKNKKHSILEPPAEKTQGNTAMTPKSEKKKKKHSTLEPSAEESADEYEVAEPPLNNVYKRKKKKKKNKLDDVRTKTEQNDECGEFAEPPLNNLYERKKKKKKNRLDDVRTKTEQIDDCGELTEPPLNNVYKRKKKKQKNKLDDVKTEHNENTVVESNAAITPKSGKKKKKHSISEISFVESQENTIENAAITPKSEKKNKKHSILEPPAEETQGNTAMTPKSEKKKKKHSKLEPSAEESAENPVEESNAVKTPKSEKKKKQKLESLVHDEDSDGAPDEAPYQSEKASEVDLENIENVSESAETSSAKKKLKKKKKKKSSASNQSGESIDTENVTSNSKKRKRKSSNADISQEDAQEVVESGEVNKFVGSNKKLKTSHNEDNTSGANESKQSKKNKKKNRHVICQDTIETTETQTKKNKKRKHEDGDRKQSKVSKDSSFQEVHVPRLPDSILRQLDDKPRTIEPATVVSTSNFIVENARRKRAKPSNYLEESIYLDAKSPLAKKAKCRISKPKVLPFIPTASTSDGGFTTNFKINKLSQFTTFEAEPVVFSKENYLQMKKIKRLGTYDRYKTQMHHKMSKF